MQNYIVQKAQQALEAIFEETPLSKRLQIAKTHFEHAEKYLDTAPEEVRKDVKAFIDSDVEHDVRRSSLTLRSAIESVFEEAGRGEVTLGKPATPLLGPTNQDGDFDPLSKPFAVKTFGVTCSVVFQRKSRN